MDTHTHDDLRGQFDGHSYARQTGQKRPAEQVDPPSFLEENKPGHKHLKQEQLDESDPLNCPYPSSDEGKQLFASHDRHGGPPAAMRLSTYSTAHQTGTRECGIPSQQPYYPSARHQGTSMGLSSEFTAGEALSEPHDAHSSNLGTLKAQTHVLQDEDHKSQKGESGRPDNGEGRLPDEHDYIRVYSENEMLRKENATLQKNIEKLQGQNGKLLSEALDLQSYKPNQTADEEDIILQWNMLKNAINNLATQKFHGHPLKRALREHQDTFKLLTPNFDHYLTKGAKPLLIEAAIWRMLVGELLGNPIRVYQAAASDTIRIIERDNRDNPTVDRKTTLPLYYNWRAHTGQLLGNIYGDKGNFETGGQHHTELANEMFRFFGRYSSHVDIQPLKLQFLGIIEKAAVLARWMAKSEYRYVCYLRDTRRKWYGMAVDETVMEVEAENPSGDGKVELLVSPALLKYRLIPETDKQEFKVVVKARICW